MRNKWGSVVGPGGRRPLGVGLAQLKPGQNSKIINWAPHATIIDNGLRMSKPGRFLSSTIKRGKRKGQKRKVRGSFRIGSPKAPNGVVKPALSAVESRKDAIRAKVIARMERGR